MAIQRKVVHVEFFVPIDGKLHYYFGSKPAIFQRFTSEQIGLTLGSLNTKAPQQSVPIITKKCIIRFGRLIASKGIKERKKE